MNIVDENVVDIVFWVALVVRKVRVSWRWGTKDSGFTEDGQSS